MGNLGCQFAQCRHAHDMRQFCLRLTQCLLRLIGADRRRNIGSAAPIAEKFSLVAEDRLGQRGVHDSGRDRVAATPRAFIGGSVIPIKPTPEICESFGTRMFSVKASTVVSGKVSDVSPSTRISSRVTMGAE